MVAKEKPIIAEGPIPRVVGGSEYGGHGQKSLQSPTVGMARALQGFIGCGIIII